VIIYNPVSVNSKRKKAADYIEFLMRNLNGKACCRGATDDQQASLPIKNWPTTRKNETAATFKPATAVALSTVRKNRLLATAHHTHRRRCSTPKRER
jgi:hypothetical protein